MGNKLRIKKDKSSNKLKSKIEELEQNLFQSTLETQELLGFVSRLLVTTLDDIFDPHVMEPKDHRCNCHIDIIKNRNLYVEPDKACRAERVKMQLVQDLHSMPRKLWESLESDIPDMVSVWGYDQMPEFWDLTHTIVKDLLAKDHWVIIGDIKIEDQHANFDLEYGLPVGLFPNTKTGDMYVEYASTFLTQCKNGEIFDRKGMIPFPTKARSKADLAILEPIEYITPEEAKRRIAELPEGGGILDEKLKRNRK